MGALRKYMGWVFAVSSLLAVCFAPMLILDVFRWGSHSLFPLRSLLICMVFPILALIFGFAWWAIWKDRSSAKGWGITASTLHILMSLLPFVLLRRSIVECQLLGLALGAIGLTAFLWPSAIDAEPGISKPVNNPL
jgi:hypothetical protein